MTLLTKCLTVAVLAAVAVAPIGCGKETDKLKDLADLPKQIEALKSQFDGELKPIETKIAAMKTEVEKAPADKKAEAEGKLTEANGMLAKIKEQIGGLTGLKDVASLTTLKDKVMGMIAELKKKIGL